MPDVRGHGRGAGGGAPGVPRRSRRACAEAGLPFLVGGAYAFARYTGIERFTKDFDVFVRVRRRRAGCSARSDERASRIERPFPHWLAKAYRGDDFLDLIYSSGNGVARVDERGSSTRSRARCSGAR